MIINAQVSYQDDQQRYAIIDLGSNSFHILIARLVFNSMCPIANFSEHVRLASGVDSNGMLSDDMIQKALACLERFSGMIADIPSSNVRIVGTNVLRIIANRDRFLMPASKILSHKIDVISGYDEAKLIYLGISHTRSDDGLQSLIVDIGGGSTELVIGKQFIPKLVKSISVGCVSCTCNYFPDDELNEYRFDQLVFFVKQTLANFKDEFIRNSWQLVVGASGTIKAIGFLLKSEGYSFIDHDGLLFLKNKLLQFTKISSIVIPNLLPAKSPILPAGVAILLALFESLHIKIMEYSSGALREGVFYKLLNRTAYEDVKLRTVIGLQKRYRVNVELATRVKNHALDLFYQVEKALGLGTKDKELLTVSAQLHGVGGIISSEKYWAHSEYLLSNSMFDGFSEIDKFLIVKLVGTHRGDVDDNLSSDMSINYLRILILLRMSVILTYFFENKVECLVRTDSNCLQFEFQPGWLISRSDLQRVVSEEKDIFSKQISHLYFK